MSDLNWEMVERGYGEPQVAEQFDAMVENADRLGWMPVLNSALVRTENERNRQVRAVMALVILPKIVSERPLFPLPEGAEWPLSEEQAADWTGAIAELEDIGPDRRLTVMGELLLSMYRVNEAVVMGDLCGEEDGVMVGNWLATLADQREWVLAQARDRMDDPAGVAWDLVEACHCQALGVEMGMMLLEELKGLWNSDDGVFWRMVGVSTLLFEIERYREGLDENDWRVQYPATILLDWAALSEEPIISQHFQKTVSQVEEEMEDVFRGLQKVEEEGMELSEGDREMLWVLTRVRGLQVSDFVKRGMDLVVELQRVRFCAQADVVQIGEKRDELVRFLRLERSEGNE